jgi:tyrosyl-tRNA synthetase
MNNVLIFPKLRKLDIKEITTDEEVREIAKHYTDQFRQLLENHGIQLRPSMYKDFVWLSEIQVAIIKRALGEHHDLQDMMDDEYRDSLHGEGMPLHNFVDDSFDFDPDENSPA